MASKNLIRSRTHLKFVSEQPCIICSRPDVQSAHIRYAGAGIGMKPSDHFVVPLCIDHHSEQHRMNERMFWHLYKKDPLVYAFFFCLQSPDKKIKKSSFDKFRNFFE